MKTYALTFFLGMISLTSQSQNLARQVFGNAGTSTQNGQYALCWTLGELAVTSLSTANLVVAQGFWQPGCSEVVGGEEPVAADWNIRCYPNPTSGDLTVERGGNVPDLQVQVLTADGRVVQQALWTSTAALVLPIAELPVGAYFLRLFSNDSPAEAQTFAVVKN